MYTLSEGAQIVDEEYPIKVIRFMLYSTGGPAGKGLCLLIKVTVQIAYPDSIRAGDIIPYIRNTQATLYHNRTHLSLFNDFRIDENHGAVVHCTLNHFGHRICIQYKELDILTDLWCSQTHAVGVVHGVKHVIYQLL